MSKIFRTSDRIPVKIDDITITIAPLSFDQKLELQTTMMSATQDPMNAIKGARLAIKMAVKSVAGVEDMNGQPYVTEIGEDGCLTDKCVDDLINMQEYPKLVALCSQLIAGIPKAIIDPATKKPLEGVTIEVPKGKPKAARK